MNLMHLLVYEDAKSAGEVRGKNMNTQPLVKYVDKKLRI